MKNCLNCTKEFDPKDKRQKFCGMSCSGTYSNKNRPAPTTDQREKISRSLKQYYQNNPEKIKRGTEQALLVARGTRGKYKKQPKNIYELSDRTRVKIIRRLKLSCCICGWNEDTIDIHHIIAVKDGGVNDHKNLTPLCPNHHRLAGRGKIESSKFITIYELTKDMWLDYYYG